MDLASRSRVHVVVPQRSLNLLALSLEARMRKTACTLGALIALSSACNDTSAPAGPHGLPDAAGSDASAGDAGNDPLFAAPTCTSGAMVPQTRRESDDMNPGMACIQCHTDMQEAASVTVAGTVFPTGHEPDLCNAQAASVAGATVIFTDVAGTEHRMPVSDASGNFHFKGPASFPGQARVVDADGHERRMLTPVMHGDCNLCHTQDGANAAPGRITMPF
jgi:hypothetical protein